MLDLEIQLLEFCHNNRCGIREILDSLGGSHTSRMRLIEEFEQAGVLESVQSPNGRGRPRRIVALSPLGVMVLDKLRSTNRMLIKINANDIRHVKEQLKLRNKLLDAGIDPYDRFMEMNKLALAIRDSTEPSTRPKLNKSGRRIFGG
mgnify:CR=1 FL=1